MGPGSFSMRPCGLALLLTTCLFASVFGALRTPAAATAATRPNVIIINTDDQRGPGTLDAMPKLRAWLKAQGRIYWHGVVNSPSCCPNRSSLMTGLYVHNHHVDSQHATPNFPTYRSLQHYLHGAGYYTGIAGKYLNNWNLSYKPPDFDRDAVLSGGYTNQSWNVDGVRKRLYGYTTTIIGDKSVEFLKSWKAQNDARPFYLYVAPTAPHSPFVPEAKYANYPILGWSGDPAVNEDTSDKPPFLRVHAPIPWSTITSTRVQQLRCLKSVDDVVGRLHDLLQSQGELWNTLVIYTSDNGYEWGEHRWISKFVPYSESVHVPLLMAWPGHIPAGDIQQTRWANTVDIMPTVLQAAGVAPNPAYPMDGRSLLGPDMHTRAFMEYFNDSANGAEINAWAADRTLTYLYVEDYNVDGSLLMREYYDLTADRWEVDNLLADGDPSNDPPAARLDGLHAQLAADRTCKAGTCP